MTDTSEILDAITPKQTAKVNSLNAAIWQTADDYLRLIVPAENYGDYIIPFTVLRRLEGGLESTKKDVLVLVHRENVKGTDPSIVNLKIENMFKLRFGTRLSCLLNAWLPPLGTLVALSGSLTAEQIDDFVPGVQEPYTETNMNPDLRERGIPQAFAGDQSQVLIVANKYQTGFDQPLLFAMYVDKRLDGIEAVQTLSRLNRTLPSKGKDTMYILDFVNDTDTILDALLPYYRTAEIIETTDPDLVHDLARKLEIAGIYTKDDVDAFAQAFIIEKKHGKHTAPLKQAADRFNDHYVAALADNTKAEIDELDFFRKDVGSFVRLYDFLSQVVEYQDTDLEKLALFLRLLRPRLTGRKTPEELDFNNIELTLIKQTRQSEGAISLGGDGEKLNPMGVGGGRSRDPHLVAWEGRSRRFHVRAATKGEFRAKAKEMIDGYLNTFTSDWTKAKRVTAFIDEVSEPIVKAARLRPNTKKRYELALSQLRRQLDGLTIGDAVRFRTLERALQGIGRDHGAESARQARTVL